MSDLKALQAEVRTLRQMIERMNRGAPIGRNAGDTHFIRQVAHGLAINDVVRHNGTGWVKAQADTSSNAVVGGVVVEVLNADEFIVATGGYVRGLSGLTAGAIHHLSDATAGLMDTTARGTPVLHADSATSGMLLGMARHPSACHFCTKRLVSGSTTFVVPAGVYRMRAIIVGGGGGAGYTGVTNGATSRYFVTAALALSDELRYWSLGGGGGAGAFVCVEFDVVPGESISYTVGAGGAASAGAGTAATSGGASSITVGTMVITAGGGAGGTDPTDTGAANPSRGGTLSTMTSPARRLTGFAIPGQNGSPAKFGIRNFSSGVTAGILGYGGAGFTVIDTGTTSSQTSGRGGDALTSVGGGTAGGAGAVAFFW